MERARSKRTRLMVASGVAAAVVAVIAIGVGVTLAATRPTAAAEVDLAALTAADVASAEATGAAVLVEVPDVTTLPLEEAELMLSVAGLEVVRISTPPGDEPTGTVLAQAPVAGERVTSGSTVELVWADPGATVPHTAGAAGTAASALTAERPPGRALVVCIDPGHQAQANTDREPIGPGANETKPKVTGGGTGVVTKQSEYALTLAVSLKVKERLEARGVTVVLTRSANEVDIANSQRAEVANRAGADLFVRIHADSSTNADERGISTLYPGGNAWVAPIERTSLEAARAVHAAVIAATGAADKGLVKRADLSGFNYATVPAILVETGYLSNPIEDRRLADPTYQDTLADGIAAGILAYLGK